VHRDRLRWRTQLPVRAVRYHVAIRTTNSADFTGGNHSRCGQLQLQWESCGVPKDSFVDVDLVIYLTVGPPKKLVSLKEVAMAMRVARVLRRGAEVSGVAMAGRSVVVSSLRILSFLRFAFRELCLCAPHHLPLFAMQRGGGWIECVGGGRVSGLACEKEDLPCLSMSGLV
jgi:hypothetical protein